MKIEICSSLHFKKCQLSLEYIITVHITVPEKENTETNQTTQNLCSSLTPIMVRQLTLTLQTTKSMSRRKRNDPRRRHTPQSFKTLKPSHFINLFPSRYWSQSSHTATSSSHIKPPTVTGETHPPSSRSLSSHVKPFISIIRVMSSQQLVTKSENVTKVIITTVIKRNGFC